MGHVVSLLAAKEPSYGTGLLHVIVVIVVYLVMLSL